MDKKRIFILTRANGIFVAAAIFVVIVLGYNFVETVEISDREMYFAEIISDVQEIFDDADTTILSITGINQSNLQAADNQWEAIYKYADEFQGK